MTPLYLDDLAPGLRFASPSTVTLDEASIVAFASQFDPQPFHTDPEAARSSPFAGLAASGWHTAALSMRLLASGGLPFAGGLIGLGGEISWPRPTRPGDTLRTESEILAIQPSRSKPNQAVVTVRNTTLNQHGEPVQIFTVKALVFRRPGYTG